MQKIKIMSGKFESIVILSLLLSTILQTYGWEKYDFSFIITSFLSVLYIFKYGIRNTMPKFLLYYIFYRIAVHIISANGYAEMIPLGLLKSLLAYLMFFGINDYSKFHKYYRIIAIIAIIFFYIQELSYHILGNRVLGIFSFLPISMSKSIDLVSILAESSRSSSFFSEPAHLAQFLLPLFCIEVFARRKNIPIVIFLGLTLLLSFSGNAIWGVAVVGISYIISVMKGRNIATKLKVAFLVIPAILGLLYIYVNSEMGQKTMSRSETLSTDYINSRGASHSSYLRIFRGFAVYDNYGTIEKIIGNDNGNYFYNSARTSEAALFFKDQNDTYINTFQSFLLYSGIVGVVFFILIFGEIWKKSYGGGRVSLLVFYALSVVAALYLTDTMALYLVVALIAPKGIEYKQIKK